MTTKIEFISAVQKHERMTARWAKIAGFFLAGTIFSLAVMDYAKTHIDLTWLGATSPMDVFAVVWTIGVCVVLGLLVVNTWRCRVSCPHCKKQLMNFSARIAVATGICGYCGEKIFEQSFKKA